MGGSDRCSPEEDPGSTGRGERHPEGQVCGPHTSYVGAQWHWSGSQAVNQEVRLSIKRSNSHSRLP